MPKSLEFAFVGRDKSLGKTLRGVSRDADKAHSRMAAFAGAFAGGALTAGVIQFGKGSAAAFKEAEESQQRLNFALAKYPKLADTNAKALGKINAALARKTRFDDDAIASGQAVLAQFNLTGKQLEEVTPLLVDYAAKTGQDIPEAAKALGMAFNGNTRALKPLGINYKATGNRAKDFANVQALVSAKVRGFAEKDGKTAAGQAAILGNRYGELQESVGAHLVPALNDLSGKLLTVLDFADRNSKVIKPLAIAVGGFAAAVWGVNKAVAAGKAVMAASTAVRGLFTAGVVAEGRAASVTTGQLTALTTAEGAAGAGGLAARGGILALGSAAALAAPPAAALAAALWAIKRASEDPRSNANTMNGTTTATIDLPKKSATVTFNGRTYAADGSGELGKRPNGSVVSISPGNRTIGLRARGGNIEAGGAYIVGENGPELVTAHRSGYVHTAAQTRRMLINPRARLDTSQIVDNRRSADRLLLTPVGPARFGKRAPDGMSDYIRQHTVITLDGKKFGTSQTRRTNARVSRGHLPPGLI